MMNATKTRERNWDDPAGNVAVSDGVVTSRATFSPQATLDRILREYLRTYGYCDPREIEGTWWEGSIQRNGERAQFWVLVKGGKSIPSFTRPAPGQVRSDGYRY